MVLQDRLDLEPANVAHWFDANKLSMNVSKTKLMHFRHCRNIRNNVEFDVSIGGEAIEFVSHFKYLGVTVDKHLSFDTHIDKLCGKVNS